MILLNQKKTAQPAAADNPRFPSVPSGQAQPKLLKEQRPAVLLRGGEPWSRLREKTFLFSC
jgi:hypothetical protein